MDKTLIRALQRMLANTTVGPSSARSMGPRGTIAAAREFLVKLNLTQFHVETRRDFDRVLDRTTDSYVRRLPRQARNWGAARKWLNIFLRAVVYNRFLCGYYRLGKLERWLEIPLDSHVAKGLRREEGGNEIPRWKTVIGLTPDVSKQYQDFANVVARRNRTSRVHLDLIYWRAPDSE